MQQTVEKWLYAATRVTHLKNAGADLEGPRHPRIGVRLAAQPARLEHPQRRGRDHRLPDRPGPRLRRQRRLLPRGHGEVPAPVRRHVRRLPPARIGDQAAQLRHRPREPHADRGDDVHGRRDRLRQARARRSCRPSPTASSAARSACAIALQFSFNVPSIKAGIIQGIDLVFNREQEFGLVFPPGADPGRLAVGRRDRGPPDRPARRLRQRSPTAACLMPRTMILEVTDKDGKVVYPTAGDKPVGKRLVSPQAAYIMSDILDGNTIKSDQPDLGQVADPREDGRRPVRRPAAYKTGTTNDRKDTAAYGYLAPPDDPNAPASRSASGWATPTRTPNTDSLSLESSAPLWSRILTEVSQDLPIARFKRPDGLVDVDGRRLQRAAAGPGHRVDGQGDLHRGHRAHAAGQPARQRPDRRRHRPALAGGLHRTDGDAGRSSTSARPSSASRSGSSTPRSGRSAPRAGPASAADRRTRGRCTSTT